LLFDGTDIDITTDFMVSHQLSYKPQKGKVILVVQLLGLVQKAFSIIGRQFPDIPDGSLALPAPKIWAKNKDLLVEYDIYLGGGLGFELIRETAKVVGRLEDNPDHSKLIITEGEKKVPQAEAGRLPGSRDRRGVELVRTG
jgi:hypothetical protein